MKHLYTFTTIISMTFKSWRMKLKSLFDFSHLAEAKGSGFAFLPRLVRCSGTEVLRIHPFGRGYTNNNVSYPSRSRRDKLRRVSIMQKRKWIPAFAGITMWGMFLFSFLLLTCSGIHHSMSH